MPGINVSDLKSRGEHLFGKSKTRDSLFQEIADNFFPERADFTVTRYTGDELAENLMTSVPILARRDLANIFSGMLRPSDKQWFFMRPRDIDLSNESLRWLDMATTTMNRAMYDRKSNFVRATKEGDNDYSAFGQCVLSAELDRKTNTLLYRSWHMKDVTWDEGINGQVNEVHRNWTLKISDAKKFFNGKLHPAAAERLAQDRNAEMTLRHIVIESDKYESDEKYLQPYVSIYLDVENDFPMEEVGSWNLIYIIPRWQTVSGSQYAYSPAVVAALPDARLIQSMTLTLLEAGEKAVNPPMVATQEALRSDIAMYAGGVTFVDSDYDERLGEVLRPLTQDRSAMPLGIEMQRDLREQIAAAFYLNKIGLPPMNKEMTAFEVGQRVSEYVRNALPLFEPMEMEYNGALCEMTFDLLLRNGGFGSIHDIPEEIRGMDIPFVFESPLQEAKEHQKGQKFMETKAMLTEAAQLDPNSAAILDVNTAIRDVFAGIGTPAKWINSESDVEEIQEQAQQQQQMQQTMEMMQQGGQAAKTIGEAGEAMQSLQV